MSEQEPTLASLHWEGGMYHGNVRNKMPHGEGTLRTMDGQDSLYEGHWADGKRHGKGKEYAPCQVYNQQQRQLIQTKMCLVYEGDFVEGKREGQKGTEYKALDGRMVKLYEGEWKDNRRHRQGKAYYWWGGSVLWFDGEWREGLAKSGTLFPDGTASGWKKADGSTKYPVKPIRWQAGQKIPNRNVPGYGEPLHQLLEDQDVSGYFPAGAL
ncbi:unnamed protein product [Vitrella brassicaformis CCMP3155]|uniref:MORN repeat-containing protein 3 n=1 Tax=Vitrella brassicaformis (strain CCMP3155) TaxID=1169540 RepID=A0A0G4E8L1_VITBC|nr:unnamed protein product [Vitrella brassicaformis CCMP3155]|eukprot:CEL92144.1 unnamed protein product [Vitrella brassicaformis CCMP3155]